MSKIDFQLGLSKDNEICLRLGDDKGHIHARFTIGQAKFVSEQLLEAIKEAEEAEKSQESKEIEKTIQ